MFFQGSNLKQPNSTSNSQLLTSKNKVPPFFDGGKKDSVQ